MNIGEYQVDRLDSVAASKRLDMLRDLFGYVAKHFRLPADPGVITAQELWRVTDPNHVTTIWWDREKAKGLLCGDIGMDATGKMVFSLSWIYFHGRMQKEALWDFARGLGAKAVVIQSPRGAKMVKRWQPDFREVMATYRREL